MTSIFGGKQSVSDSGFGMDATSLASILGNGAHAYQYADITTSGGWFSSDKSSEQTNPLGEAANQQFTAIISRWQAASSLPARCWACRATISRTSSTASWSTSVKSA
jgi:hypothetical protein